MTITTLEQAMAGMQPVRPFHKGAVTTAAAGRWWSAYTVPGIPDSGTVDTTTVGGVALTQGNNNFSMTVTGCIPHYDPAPGLSSYVANFNVISAAPAGVFVLADRLWHCGANTSGQLVPGATGVQTINSVAWPARDNNQSANGAGVLAALEVSVAISAVVPSYTITYVNSDGTVGLSASNLHPVASGTAAQSFYPFASNNGDHGVQNVTTFQASASSGIGTYNLVAYRPIVQIDAAAGDSSVPIDVISGGFPQVYNGACLFILFFAFTSGQWSPYGHYQETQG